MEREEKLVQSVRQEQPEEYPVVLLLDAERDEVVDLDRSDEEVVAAV